MKSKATSDRRREGAARPPDLLRLIVRVLDEKKAEDLKVLAVGAQSSITDYLVLATGTSQPHLRALRVDLEKALDAAKVPVLGVESEDGSGWAVFDAFEVMVHIFTAANREKYGLERLWKDVSEVSVAELLTAPAPSKSRPARPRAPKRRPKGG
jgi:ribosome-associated protein